jgi:hypothetical protein
MMWRNAIYWGIFTTFCCGFGTCQREQPGIPLVLNQVIYNSYQRVILGANALALAANETVIFDQDRKKVSTRSTDVKVEGTAFRLSLIDKDQDGRFDTPGVDLVVVSIYGQDTVALDLQSAHVGVLRPQTFIQVNRRCFLLAEISASGQEVTLVPWENCSYDILAARTKTHLGKIPVRDLAGQDTFLVFPKTDTRQRLVIVWSMGTEDLELISYLQQNQAVWRTRFQIVGLNMVDQPRKINAFLAASPVDFPVYLVTRKTCETINCHALLPYAIWLDATGEIVDVGLKKEQLLALLESAGRPLDQ